MKVLVTGGSGFIGTNLVEFYLSKGHIVANFDILMPRNPLHSSYWQQVDITNFYDLSKRLLEFNPDVIFHMAARTDLDGTSIDDYAANTLGVKNVIDAANDLNQLRRIIFSSSRLVCALGYQPKNDLDFCPTTIYGQSKVIGERIVRDSMGIIGCDALIVRPTSIWGPWFDIPYRSFFLAINKNQYFHPSKKRILKSFGYIGNTVHQLNILMQAPSEKVNGKTLYMGDYPPTELASMAEAIQNAMGVKPIKSIDLRILKLVAYMGDIAKKVGWIQPPLTTFRLNNLITPMLYDLSPLEEMVGALPFSVEDGVRDTVNWMRERDLLHA